MITISTKPTRAYQAEVERQQGFIQRALDKLFELEVPSAEPRPGPALRLVSPLGEQADELIANQRATVAARAYLVSRGWELWETGGEIELFNTMRKVMEARPERKRWNRSVLSSLWADVGLGGRESA
jgi:hypothetical protein